MYYLVDKYAPFEEALGPPRLKDFDRASLSKERDHTIEWASGAISGIVGKRSHSLYTYK